MRFSCRQRHGKSSKVVEIAVRRDPQSEDKQEKEEQEESEEGRSIVLCDRTQPPLRLVEESEEKRKKKRATAGCPLLMTNGWTRCTYTEGGT